MPGGLLAHTVEGSSCQFRLHKERLNFSGNPAKSSIPLRLSHSTSHPILPHDRLLAVAMGKSNTTSSTSDFDPATAVFTPNSDAEKALVRKLDKRIVGLLHFRYF